MQADPRVPGPERSVPQEVSTLGQDNEYSNVQSNL